MRALRSKQNFHRPQSQRSVSFPYFSLRSIVRNLLATGPPGIAPAFTNSARSRLRQTNAKTMGSAFSFFDHQPHTGSIVPTQRLYDTLTRARLLYGAGMGFASLGLLASIVRATLGLQWEEDDDMEDILAIVDADIGQAIQASAYLFYSRVSGQPPSDNNCFRRVPRKK